MLDNVWVNVAPSSSWAGPAAFAMTQPPVELSTPDAPRRNTPPLTFVPPVQALVLPESVKIPVPTLVRVLPVVAVPLVKVPENVVVKFAPPVVSVLAVEVEFVTVPAPLKEPIVWSRELMSTVAPALMSRGLVAPNAAVVIPA